MGWKDLISIIKGIICAYSFHFHVISVPAECDSSSTLEVWSVGASPRLPKIDPVTLLPGARPSLRENHSVEVAVSFDQPAQFNATLPNAGKVSDGSYSYRNNLIIIGYWNCVVWNVEWGIGKRGWILGQWEWKVPLYESLWKKTLIRTRAEKIHVRSRCALPLERTFQSFRVRILLWWSSVSDNQMHGSGFLAQILMSSGRNVMLYSTMTSICGW